MIRVARPDEYELLRTIEEVADALFLEVGIGPFQQSEDENHLTSAAVVLVAEDPPVGFVCVEVVDCAAHIWQLSVHPSAAKKGIGTALVNAACEWAISNGWSAITLTTFRDVPWNGPFYKRLGFCVLDELTPGLVVLRDHERAIGHDNFGQRYIEVCPVCSHPRADSDVMGSGCNIPLGGGQSPCG